MDEPHFLASLGYVDRNPVRAGMVAWAWDYAWSSALFHSGLASGDPLAHELSPFGMDLDWGELIGRDRGWEIDRIRVATRRCVPVGSKVFLAGIAMRTGVSPLKWIATEDWEKVDAASGQAVVPPLASQQPSRRAFS